MTPSNPLTDGKYKIDIGANSYIAGTFANDVLEWYGSTSPQGYVNVYDSQGGATQGTAPLSAFSNIVNPILDQYDNIKEQEITDRAGNIVDFGTYVELSAE